MDAKGFHSVFSLFEIVEMENILKVEGEGTLNQELCEKIATTFSSSAAHAGKPPITWEQVYSWFEDKQKETLEDDTLEDETSSPAALQLCVDLSDEGMSRRAHESHNDSTFLNNQDVDLSELAFEAVSFKDSAWYDITNILSYRIMSTGELEARVRFSGYGKEHDEWVNVKKELRERSIPLEASECHRIRTRDLVLCFRDGLHQALYYDAHVVHIERNHHGADECTCVFLVRYTYDSFEEKVGLGRLCCRPSQEESQRLSQLLITNTASSLNVVPSDNPYDITPDNLWG